MAHVSRRIRKESEKWDDRENEIYTLITDESKLKVEVIILEIERYNQLIFDFIIPFEYPFSPPEVLLKGVPLKRYYFTSRLFRKELKSIKNIDCLCCASILCQHNWGPTLNITNIVDEIIEFFNIKLKMVEKYMVLKVMKNMPEVLSKYVLQYI